MASLLANYQEDERESRTLQYSGLFFPLDADAPRDWAHSFRRLFDFFLLEAGWDGESAKPPARETIMSIEQLLKQLHSKGWPAPSRIVAGLEGEMIVEWQDSTLLLEIEIVGPYEGEAMLKEGGSRRFFPVTWESLPRPKPTHLSQGYS